MADRYLKLNDIDAYKVSFHLCNYVWDIIIGWKPFAQRTVGEQYIFTELQKLPEVTNRLIKFTNAKLSK